MAVALLILREVSWAFFSPQCFPPRGPNSHGGTHAASSGFSQLSTASPVCIKQTISQFIEYCFLPEEFELSRFDIQIHSGVSFTRRTVLLNVQSCACKCESLHVGTQWWFSASYSDECHYLKYQTLATSSAKSSVNGTLFASIISMRSSQSIKAKHLVTIWTTHEKDKTFQLTRTQRKWNWVISPDEEMTIHSSGSFIHGRKDIYLHITGFCECASFHMCLDISYWIFSMYYEIYWFP